MSYLKYYACWIAMVCLLSGCVGGAVKATDDANKANEQSEKRSETLKNNIKVRGDELPNEGDAFSKSGRLDTLPEESDKLEVGLAISGALTIESSAADGSNALTESRIDGAYVISLQTKTPRHPFYGVGDTKGYIIDGVEGKELILHRGTTYTFIIRSNPMHDVYISSDAMGWGTKVIEDGVEGNFTYDGKIQITPTANTPDVIYYQCQNHKAMGARIFIVDEGDTRSLSELVSLHGDLNSKSAADTIVGVSLSEAKQKLSYANIVSISKSVKRVRDSGNIEAIALLDISQKQLIEAESLLQLTDGEAAMPLIDSALQNMSQASKMVPSAGLKEEQKQRYSDMQKHLAQQKKSYADVRQQTVSQDGIVVDYKRDEVARIEASAARHANAAAYTAGLADLQRVDKIITSAINDMLDSQTVTYTLDIESPEGEYNYEYDRYLGYAELIPVAIEEKKPSEGEMMLVNGFVTKADAMRAKGEAMAQQESYPEAIRLMQEGTKMVRKALRMLGVKQ